MAGVSQHNSEGGSVPTEGDVMISWGAKMPSMAALYLFETARRPPEGGIIFSGVVIMHSKDDVLNTGRRDAFSRRHYVFFWDGITPFGLYNNSFKMICICLRPL